MRHLLAYLQCHARKQRRFRGRPSRSWSQNLVYYAGDLTGNCSQGMQQPTDRLGIVTGVDRCHDTGASQALWGSLADGLTGGLAVGITNLVDCGSQKRGEVGGFQDSSKYPATPGCEDRGRRVGSQLIYTDCGRSPFFSSGLTQTSSVSHRPGCRLLCIALQKSEEDFATQTA